MEDHIIKKLERIFDDAVENEDLQVIQTFNRLGSMPKNYNEWYIKDLSYDYEHDQLKRYFKYIKCIPQEHDTTELIADLLDYRNHEAARLVLDYSNIFKVNPDAVRNLAARLKAYPQFKIH